MNCKITVTPDFLKEMKHLSKRYKSLKEDLNKLGDELERNPFLGVELGRSTGYYLHGNPRSDGC